MKHMKKILFALMCWFLIGTVNVQADETIKHDVAEGVLQEGDMLAEGVITPKMSTQTNVSGAKAAIVAAAQGLQDTVDLTAYRIPVSQIASVFGETLNENPRLFYISGVYQYYYNSGYVTTFCLQYEDNKSQIPVMLLEYDHEVNKILSQMDSRWTPMEKILFVNEYLALNCEYSEETLANRNIDTYDAYNVFVGKKAVCQGYALAVEELMDRLGIPCELVSSSGADHAWNVVYLNGKWYHMDVTWNDPISDRVGQARHLHLLKSTQNFYQTHVNSQTGAQIRDYVYTGGLSDYSAYYSTAYDNCFWDTVNTPFSYQGGYWYNITVDTTNGVGYLNRYSCDGTWLIQQSTVATLTEKWLDTWNKGNSYYWYYFGECASYMGYLYYSTPTKILVRYSNGAIGTVYELNSVEKSQGYIYGFSIDPYGELRLGLAKNPNEKITNIKTNYFHGHTAGAAATCTSHQTCTTCGKIMTKALGHAPGAAATCTTPQVCIHGCGTVYAPAKGHTPNISAPTCTSGQTCVSCGLTLANATGHVHTYQKTLSATFKKGKTKATCCSSCNAVLSSKTYGKKISCKKGAIYTVGNYKYKIISNKTNGKGTVAFHGLKKNVSKVVIGNTVTIKGVKFIITEISAKALRKKSKLTTLTIGSNIKKIGREACYGSKKLKKVYIKSKKITSVGKNALRNLHKKATIYVPQSRISKYRKLF